METMDMRYATIRIAAARGYFHPLEARLREQGAVPERIHAIRLLRDGVTLALYETTGERQQVRDAVEATAGVRSYSLAENYGRIVVFLETETEAFFEEVLQFFRTQRVIVDYPIELVESRRSVFRIKEIGPQEALQRIVKVDPDAIDVEVEEVGQYDPFENQLFAVLTERQQEVLLTAYEKGYFDPPREVTHEDIAADLDCNAATVGHHLMQIEARLVNAIVPTREPAGIPSKPGDVYTTE